MSFPFLDRRVTHGEILLAACWAKRVTYSVRVGPLNYWPETETPTDAAKLNRQVRHEHKHDSPLATIPLCNVQHDCRTSDDKESTSTNTKRRRLHAVQLMTGHGVRHLIVLDSELLVAVLAQSDIPRNSRAP